MELLVLEISVKNNFAMIELKKENCFRAIRKNGATLGA